MFGLAMTAAVAAVFSSFPALAFFPPEDSRDGVSMRLVGFDEGRSSVLLEAPQRDASAPFGFDVAIANANDEPVSGDLAFWLNDDWDVAAEAALPDKDAQARHPDAQALSCTIPPHSTNSFFATAIPRPGRVLPALYPIHATFALPSGEPLHPIAVFLAVAGGASRPGPVPRRYRRGVHRAFP